MAASIALLALASPVAAAETDFTAFPFETAAGEQRALVVYADAGRRVRVVFVSLDVQRPSEDAAILRPGGDGRVIVQVRPEGEDAFRTGAVLEFGGESLTLTRRDGRATLTGSLESVALPRADDPRVFRGRVSFEGLALRASWPMLASDAFQDADIALDADAVTIDRALLPQTATADLTTGAVALEGTVSVLMREDAVAATAPPVLRRVTLDRASIAALGGRIEAAGVADFARALPPALSGLRGVATVSDFPDMLEGLLRVKLAGPGVALSLAGMMRGFGEVQSDRSILFRVETTPEGVTVNGKPTGFAPGG